MSEHSLCLSSQGTNKATNDQLDYLTIHLPKLDLPLTEEQRLADILTTALEERTALQTKSDDLRQKVAACKEQFSHAKGKNQGDNCHAGPKKQQRLKNVGRTGLTW